MLKSVPVRAAGAALSLALLSLAALPARAGDVLATSGHYVLTQNMVNDDLAVWQIVTDRPLAPADRQAIQAVDVSLFRHDPAWLTENVRQTHKALPGLRSADPARRAALRQNNLVQIYCTPQEAHLTAAEAARLQAVVSRYVPVVGVDAGSGTVITGRDLDAATASARFVANATKTPAYGSRFRADLEKIARHPATAGKLVDSDLTAMERNWAAFQLTWPHEPAADRARTLGRVTPQMRRNAARGQGETGLAVAALAICAIQYEDYPYALDPRLAAYKRAMDARMSRFKTKMLEYNLLNSERGMHDFARSMNGQGPDPQDYYNPIPLPVP